MILFLPEKFCGSYVIGLGFLVVEQLTNESAYAYLNIQFQYSTFRPNRLFNFVITVTGNKMRRRKNIVFVTAIASSELVSLKFLIALTSGSLL